LRSGDDNKPNHPKASGSEERARRIQDLIRNPECSGVRTLPNPKAEKIF
jgi:hypothetical protein